MQILKNPGFEEGIPNNWQESTTGTTQRFTYPEQGRTTGSSVATEYPTRDVGKRAYWFQNIQIDHTKKYNLSGWIKTQNIIGDAGGAIIQVDWKDVSGVFLSKSTIMTYQKGTIPWTNFKGDVVPDPNASKATIVLDLFDCSGKVWFDDISFSDIQPPPVSGHPNIFLNKTEVDTVKTRKDTEPWKSAYNKLMTEDVAIAMGLGIQTVVNKGLIPPSGDQHDYYSQSAGVRIDYNSAISVGKAVRALGLAYALTGDSKYANKAVQLINGWCITPATKMNPRFWYSGQNGQVFVELSVTMPGMFYGADLVWNYPGWNNTDKQAFKSWVAKLVAEAKSKDWCNNKPCQNFENWRLAFISSGAVIIEDINSITYAANRWKELIPQQMDMQGRMVEELKRGSAALSYSTFAINAMIQTAEIARHHGIDLYNYKVSNTDNRGIELALDYHAPYIVDPSSWPNNPGTTQERTRSNAAIYELAYTFKNKSSYKNVINTVGRPMYENRNMGPVTLTHSTTFV